MGNRRFTLEKMRQCLRETESNIVFLQEVIGENEKHRGKIDNWPEKNQFEFLADSVWDHYAYGKNAIYQHGHHGNAILSEIPFTEWNNVNISMMSFSQRGILHGVLESGVHLLCAHLGLFERERRRQIDKLKDYIVNEIPESDSLLLAGDFNDWRKTAHESLLQAGLIEVSEAANGVLSKTYPALLPCLPMDRIYARGFEVNSAKIMNQSHWRSISDHCAVMAEVSLIS